MVMNRAYEKLTTIYNNVSGTDNNKLSQSGDTMSPFQINNCDTLRVYFPQGFAETVIVKWCEPLISFIFYHCKMLTLSKIFYNISS